jgi:myo-inositol-1(or 4)-monophosphatase
LPVSDALKDDAALLFQAVRAAGELGLSLSTRPNLRCWTKPDGSQVTECDLAVNALLEEQIRQQRPEDGWLSEETPDEPQRLARERLWIIDPIDGTRAFIEGREEWCVAAALSVRGRPVLGAVYRPRRDEFYAAVAGQGASLNGAAISIPDSRSLEGARIAGNRKALSGLAHPASRPTPAARCPCSFALPMWRPDGSMARSRSASATTGTWPPANCS